MPKRTIDIAVDIMRQLKSRGLTRCSKATIIRYIRLYGGESQLVRQKYMQFLEDFKIISRSGEISEADGSDLYDLNFEELERLTLGI